MDFFNEISKVNIDSLGKPEKLKYYDFINSEYRHLEDASDYLLRGKRINSYPETYSEKYLHRKYNDGKSRMCNQINFGDLKKENIKSSSGEEMEFDGDFAEFLSHRNGYTLYKEEIPLSVFIEQFSEVEQKVIKLLLLGFKNVEIEKILKLSPRRLRTQIEHIEKKLSYADETETNIVQRKLCRKCLQFKNANEFGKNPQLKSGLRTYCLQCERESKKRT